MDSITFRERKSGLGTDCGDSLGLHTDTENAQKVRRETLSMLESKLALRFSTNPESRALLTRNAAAEFPYDNDNLLIELSVHRPSVRDLLRRNILGAGAKLWCSVRRSGKSTACVQLQQLSGEYSISTQTCLNTRRSFESRQLITEVERALREGLPLPEDFVRSSAGVGAIGGGGSGGRRVLILDEYEALFSKLSFAMKERPELHHVVVQPLLSDFTAFARENLLIFLGQEPNAHYIGMEKNQLSMMLRSEQFPLFAHEDEENGEFTQLVRLVLTEALTPEQTFLRELHEETAGHPLLTILVLAEFVDFLIGQRRLRSAKSVTSTDFQEYSQRKLCDPHYLGTTPRFEKMRYVVREGLVEEARTLSPWLDAVYSVLRAIARRNPTALRVTHDEYAILRRKLRKEVKEVMQADFVQTATYPNFLITTESHIAPKIRLLARIAGAVVPY